MSGYARCSDFKFHIRVPTRDARDMLRDAISLAKRDLAGKSGLVVQAEEGKLTIGWNGPDNLRLPHTTDSLTSMVEEWLKTAKIEEKEPDIDGAVSKGVEIKADVDKVTIRPVWVFFHK